MLQTRTMLYSTGIIIYIPLCDLSLDNIRIYYLMNCIIELMGYIVAGGFKFVEIIIVGLQNNYDWVIVRQRSRVHLRLNSKPWLD